MQWRPITLLLCGIAIMYLASFLQGTPFPCPLKVHTSDSTRLRVEPDKIILSIADDHLYQTTIRFEATLTGHENVKVGTGPLKTGALGFIQQLRKPLKAVLDDKPGLKNDEWEVSFQHLLRGPASKVSQISHGNKGVQFAVLYHVVKEEAVQHFARLYYLPLDQDSSATPSFEYKDLLLPGTTWINAISLEKDSILFSRDPDIHHYRILKLPEHLTTAPHSEKADTIILGSSEPGQMIKAWHQPLKTEKHQIFLSQLYSPLPETYRVLSYDIHKTIEAFYVNVTIADNASMVTQLSELREETPQRRWHRRDHAEQVYGAYHDLTLDYKNGFVDIMQYQQQHSRSSMPTESFSRSADAKSIVFPFPKHSFLSLDFTDRIDLVMTDEQESVHAYKHEDGTIIPEFYSWQKYDIETSDVYEAELTGIQVNEEGTLLAVWTDLNIIYIYKRGEADVLETNTPDGGPSETPEEKSGMPPKWALRMAISKVEGELGSSPVTAIKFTEDSQGRHYILVALKKGAVRSYLLDGFEEPVESTLWTFATDHFIMLVAMSFVVMMFAMNEYRTPQ